MSAILISVSLLLLAGLALLYFRKRPDSLPIKVEEPEQIIELPKEPEIKQLPLIDPLDLRKEINDLICRETDVKTLLAKLDCPVESNQVDHLLFQSPDSEKQSRIEALRDLIACILTADYRGRLTMNRQSIPDYIDSASSKGHLQSRAKLYLDATWMHTPSLAAMIAIVLLDCELAGSQSSEQIEIDLKPLRLIRDEIASRSFDTIEVVRRLRQIEERGCYFSSLVYPVLTEGQIGSFEEETVPESVEEPVVEEEPETIWNLTAEVSALINTTPQLTDMRERLERQLWESPSLVERHTAKAEMEQFYRLLEEVVTFRHQYDLLTGRENIIPQASLQIQKKRLQHEARQYLNTPSLHTSWLSHYVSAFLLYAELATLPDQFQQTLGQALRTIADDHAVNNCEAIESV